MLGCLRIGNAANGGAERSRELLCDSPQAHSTTIPKQPFGLIWVGRERIARKTIEPRQIALSRSVRARPESGDHRKPASREHPEIMFRPLADRQDNAGDERR